MKRDTSIDLMRFIGLTMIILAHIGLSRSTSPLFQFRSFDVPLMVFTSGLAFAGKQTGPYLSFIFKRTLRLIVPVFIFVSAYILLNPVLSDLGWVDEYTGKVIRGTYMLRLNPSIGYVWVIRVFLIVMLLTPLLLWLDRRIGKNWACLALVGVFVAVQQGLAMWLKPSENILIKDWALYVFGYSAVFLLGLRVKNMSKRSLAGVTALLAILVAGTAVYMNHEYGTIMRLQATKYPPQLYYLLWGMCMSCLLWLTSGLWKLVLDNSLFTFIGRNTIWIYLWHIPFVNIVVGGPFDHWHPVLKYVFVYIGALCLYGIQYYLVKKADTRWKNNKITRYFVG